VAGNGDWGWIGRFGNVVVVVVVIAVNGLGSITTADFGGQNGVWVVNA
jgi:hypothetical protein